MICPVVAMLGADAGLSYHVTHLHILFWLLEVSFTVIGHRLQQHQLATEHTYGHNEMSSGALRSL